MAESDSVVAISSVDSPYEEANDCVRESESDELAVPAHVFHLNRALASFDNQ